MRKVSSASSVTFFTNFFYRVSFHTANVNARFLVLLNIKSRSSKLFFFETSGLYLGLSQREILILGDGGENIFYNVE